MTAAATPPLSVPPPPPRGRGGPPAPAHALAEPRPALRAGLIGVVVVHVLLALLLWLMPAHVLEVDRVRWAPPENRSFEIELTPELLTRTEPATPPQRFVEVNPAAPENVPDNTPLFGAQNQQVAQPVPTPDGVSDTPALQGDGKEGATALVRGSTAEPAAPPASEILAQTFAPPQTAPRSLVPEREEPEAKEAPARAINPLPGGEQILGQATDGVGSTVTTLPPTPGAETGPEARRGTANARAPTGGYFAGTPAIDRAQPQQRPRLTSETINARNAPTIKNDFGSKNIGAVAYNAKWSSYGEYLQRLIDAVQAQWERLIMRSSVYPTSGALVKVVFKLDDKGEISEVLRVEGSGGEIAQRLCVSAITERAPYGEWTEDMRAALGREQELTFTFLYY